MVRLFYKKKKQNRIQSIIFLLPFVREYTSYIYIRQFKSILTLNYLFYLFFCNLNNNDNYLRIKLAMRMYFFTYASVYDNDYCIKTDDSFYEETC